MSISTTAFIQNTMRKDATIDGNGPAYRLLSPERLPVCVSPAFMGRELAPLEQEPEV